MGFFSPVLYENWGGGSINSELEVEGFFSPENRIVGWMKRNGLLAWVRACVACHFMGGICVGGLMNDGMEIRGICLEIYAEGLKTCACFWYMQETNTFQM